MVVADAEGVFLDKSASAARRRYDLDWLRVIAFGLLIFYHIGMFYVTWEWHVKSVYSGPAAEPLMLVVNPWRLALLFFISGVAIRFASDKAQSHWTFLRSRMYRLGLPIILGIAVIIAPQTYFELRQAQIIGPDYIAFWAEYLKLDQAYPMITPTWNHLWYVVYLFAYILLISPFLPAMSRFAQGGGEKALNFAARGPVRQICLFVIPFIAYEMTLSRYFPTTHALFDDWANHAHRFTIFLLGYFVAKNAQFWSSVARALPLAASLVLLIGCVRLYLRIFHREYYDDVIDGPFWTVSLTVYAWSFIVALLAVGQRYLNRPSALLSYLTAAVFCYYILHQTIIVAGGYWLTQLQLGPALEFILLTAITIGGCVMGYELIKRAPYLRVWFGIKTQ